jgi:hypothetical protein
MKKTLIIVALLTIAFSANAQWFNFSNNMKRFEIGFTVGQAGSTTEYAGLGIGANLVAFGVQVDFLHKGPEHQYDNHIESKLYNDNVAWIVNGGYQIPVLSWLKVVPMAGYCQTNEGITDASTINFNHGEYTTTFYHDYDVTPGTRQHHFNFGCGIALQPLPWMSINAAYTKYAIYGGLSLNLFGFSN